MLILAGEQQAVDYALALARATHRVDPGLLAGVIDAASAEAIPDPQVRALLTSAFALRDSLVAGLRADYDVAAAQWRAARDALRAEITAALAAPLTAIPPLQDLILAADLDAEDGLRFDQTVGPLTVKLDGGAVVAEFAAPGQFARQTLGPMIPDLLAASLAAGPATGGGALQVRDDGLAGVLAVQLGAIDVTAIASLRRGPDGAPSFLGILGVGFVPGIQLGFGFSLDRVGGLVAVNRTADTDALGRGLRGGTLGDVLFSPNPAADAPRILGAVDELFPVRTGSHLFGPMMRISWLSIGAASLFSLDVGVILELPGPVRIVIVGVARAGIPPVLQLRLDLLGVLDFERRLIAFDASLVDSGLLAVFVLTGDAAFRQSYGDQPYTVLSLGGFYPGFDPRPAQLPPLSRIGMHLDLPVPGITMRAEAYLAVTSNTVQFGGSFEAGFEAAGVSATGFLALDALIQFSPFHFHAEVSAGFHVAVAGLTFAGVRLDGTIDGPGPIVISGRLTIETFLFDISWHQSFSFGPSGGGSAVPRLSLLDELAPELSRPANLRAVGGADPLVRLAPRPSAGPLASVPPLAQIAWAQRRAPLDLPIDRLEGVPLGVTQGVRATSTAPDQQSETELFSPGSFITLTQAEALNRPAFERLDGGVRLGWLTPEMSPRNAAKPDDRQVVRKVVGEPAENQILGAPWLAVTAGVLAMIAERPRPAAVTSRTPLVVAAAETWATDAGTTHTSATAAHQQVRIGAAGLALPAADLGRPVDLSAV